LLAKLKVELKLNDNNKATWINNILDPM